jgi:hypothetical protein
MNDSKPAQAVIAPFASLLTAFLWLETWVEILSRGSHKSPDDLSKLYLAIMAAYAGAAEISKWLINAPTDPRQDPRLERIQRGGVLIGLWLIPLLFAYTWRISNDKVPLPPPLHKIVFGLVGIFFLKAASRRWRHTKHGVMDPATGEAGAGSIAQDGARDADLAEALYQKITSAPEGVSVADMTAAFPDVTRPRLYRAFNELVKTRRVTRTGKPRTPEVRYRIVGK